MDIKSYIIGKTVAIAMGIAALSQMTNEEATIRVLLMTSGYGGYYHDTVDYVELEDGTFQVNSITRANGHPVYEGELEVIETDQGYLLINELPVEDYLKYVVPSEMPPGYEMEALKAQAVCARTYAYRQIQEKALVQFCADVDDSVNFQVYNNQAADERASQAVQETSGEIMTYEDEPIIAYFFSTSSGATSTDEVWEEETAPCLKSVVSDYDSDMPWYRWNVSFTKEQVNACLQNHGYDIGDIKDIQVTRRSQGGAAVSCDFIGTEDTVTVENELNIRKLLSPYGISIERQDGSVVTDFNLLPSAYFESEPYYDENGEVQGFTFEGGGYGHGVGMSQNGANGMAKQGAGYLEILNYYFDGFTLEKK